MAGLIYKPGASVSRPKPMTLPAPGDIPWTKRLTEDELKQRIKQERVEYAPDEPLVEKRYNPFRGQRFTDRPTVDPPIGLDSRHSSMLIYGAPNPDFPDVMPYGLTMEQQEALAVRVRMEELTSKLVTNQTDVVHLPDRGQSPPPIYDHTGKRTNTAEIRSLARLGLERQDLVTEAMRMDQDFVVPPDFVAVHQYKTRKIPVPVDKFPDYNFIGIIIGPRGNTQKRLESDTGTKIAIRGRGSVKEGKMGRRDGKVNPGEDEPLHVLITGESDFQLEYASRCVRELLIPTDDAHNEHKRNQLRELAEINGTLRDRSWRMREDDISHVDRALVRCELCGETSHVSSDCYLKSTGLTVMEQTQLDKVYVACMDELGLDVPIELRQRVEEAAGLQQEAPPPEFLGGEQDAALAELMALAGGTG